MKTKVKARALVIFLLAALMLLSSCGNAIESYKAAEASYKAGDLEAAAEQYTAAYNASKMDLGMSKVNKDVIAIAYVGKVLGPQGSFLEGAKILEGVDTSNESVKKAVDELYKKYPYLGMSVEGAVVEFGTWEQEPDKAGEEPIEWVVLKVDKNSDHPKALLLSTKVIGSIASRSRTEGNTSYAKSDVHGWCEIEFYKTLNGDENIKGKILMINVHTEPSSAGVDSGEDVEAHVFAPSIQDIEEYLDNDTFRDYIRAQGTPAIKASKYKTKVTSKGFAGYWLRNAGESEGFASAVTDKGEVIEGSSTYASHGVRPMMWVSLG